MPNLFDTIQANYGNLAGQQAPATNQTQQTADLLRAKSGKQVSSPDTGQSNIQEQAANQQTTSQLQAQAPQLQLAQTGLQQQKQGQQQQYQQQSQQLGQAAQSNALQSKIKLNQTLADLAANKSQLNTDKGQAQLEQASFLISMQNKQYVDELNNYAAKNRMDTTEGFQQQMAKTKFGDALDILQQKLGNQDILNASDRQYQQAMAGITIDDANKIADIEGQFNDQYATSNANFDLQLKKLQAAQASEQQKYGAVKTLLGGLGQGASMFGSTGGGSGGAAPTDTGASSSNLAQSSLAGAGTANGMSNYSMES